MNSVGRTIIPARENPVEVWGRRMGAVLGGMVLLVTSVWAQPSSTSPGAVSQAPPPVAGKVATVPPGNPESIALLSGVHVDRMVTVVGTVSNKIAPTSTTGRAPHRWYVTDGKGVALVVLFPDTFAQLVNPDTSFARGSLIQVRGKVTDFRGQLQVVPSSAADVVTPPAGNPQGVWGLVDTPSAAVASGPSAAVASGPSAATTAPGAVAPTEASTAPTPVVELPAGYLTPGQVTRDMIDKPVKVAGQVLNFRASWSDRAPNVLTISGGGGTIDVVFWSDIEQKLGDTKARITATGSFVKVDGDLSEYREKLQVRVQENGTIELLGGGAAAPVAGAVGAPASVAPAAAATTPPPAALSGPGMWKSLPQLAPSQVAKTDVGRTIVVSGTVQSIRPSTADNVPTRVYLADDKVSLPVVYWVDMAKEFEGFNAPQVGKVWKVYGLVSEFRGELQLRAMGVAMDPPAAPAPSAP